MIHSGKAQRIAAAAAIVALGQAVAAFAAGSFSIVAIPDIQNYTSTTDATRPPILNAQMQWIIDNKTSHNIAFATQEGDVTNNSALAEYALANTAFNNLNGVLPYSVIPGNHDSNTTNFGTYFGPSRYTSIAGSSAWYLGAASDGRSFAQKFSAGGYNFLHLGLKYNAGADASTISWAQGLMAANPTLPTIITTHSYMNADSTGTYTAEAQKIWDNFAKNNSQVFMILCGHMHGEANRVDTDAAGKKVIGMLADYQSYTNGGNGYLRELIFDTDNNKIDVKTYSPTLNKFETDANSQLSWSVNFGPNNAITVNGLLVPEPASMGLLAIAAMGLVCRRRK